MTREQIKNKFIEIDSFIRNMDAETLVAELKEKLNELHQVEQEIDEWYRENDEDAKDTEIIDNEIYASELSEIIEEIVIALAYKNEELLEKEFPNLYENLITED